MRHKVVPAMEGPIISNPNPRRKRYVKDFQVAFDGGVACFCPDILRPSLISEH
jgi:hypothetical protein